MKKSILNLGAQELTKNEQKEVNGGKPLWCGYCQCANGTLAYACGSSQNVACREACWV